MRGVSFAIPNEYGKQFFDILKEVNVSRWHWWIGNGEYEYKFRIKNGVL